MENGIERGTAQCLGGFHKAAGNLAERLFCVNLNKREDHDRKRHAGGEHTAAPVQIAHEKTVGKQAEHNGRDAGDALQDRVYHRTQATALTEEHEIQCCSDGRKPAQHGRRQGESEAPGDGGENSALLTQINTKRNRITARTRTILSPAQIRAISPRTRMSGSSFQIPPRRSSRLRRAEIPRLIMNRRIISANPAA